MDRRDGVEHAAVQCPLGRAAGRPSRRIAYADGAGTIALTHLVGDRPDLTGALTEAFLAGYGRSLERSGRHFRP